MYNHFIALVRHSATMKNHETQFLNKLGDVKVQM